MVRGLAGWRSGDGADRISSTQVRTQRNGQMCSEALLYRDSPPFLSFPFLSLSPSAVLYK